MHKLSIFQVISGLTCALCTFFLHNSQLNLSVLEVSSGIT
jgi:hypothetical protein